MDTGRTKKNPLQSIYIKYDNKIFLFSEEAFVEHRINTIECLPFSSEIARIQPHLGCSLRTSGQTVGAHDLLITATVLCYGYKVLTLNYKDFSKTPGLQTLEITTT